MSGGAPALGEGNPPVAPGKLILFGEHAVVFGRRALGAALPLGLELRDLAPLPPARLELEVAAWGLRASAASAGVLGEALRCALAAGPGAAASGGRFVLDAALPAGAGLGSSAALALVLSRGLAALRGEPALAGPELWRRIQAVEGAFHGRPSGLDASLVTAGGVQLFQNRPEGPAPPPGVAARPAGPCALSLDLDPPPLVLGWSGRQRSTGPLVRAVAEQRRRSPASVEQTFAAIDVALDAGLVALQERDWGALASPLRQAQAALLSLQLGCPEHDQMAALAQAQGALACKLTGAGGGGCLFALAPGREEAVAGAWRGAGFAAWILSPRPGAPKGSRWRCP